MGEEHKEDLIKRIKLETKAQMEVRKRRHSSASSRGNTKKTKERYVSDGLEKSAPANTTCPFLIVIATNLSWPVKRLLDAPEDP